MKRQKFMSELEVLLRDIPEHDRLDAIAYYNDYFDEAGIEKEELILRELGSPKKVADAMKEGLSSSDEKFKITSQDWSLPRNRDQKSESSQSKIANEKKIPWFLLVLLLIFFSPVLIGVIAGIFGGLIGLIGALFGVTVGAAGSGFGLFLGGLVCFVTGFVRVFANPLEGLTSMGIGALLISIGILLVLLFVILIRKWIPVLVKGFIDGCKYVYHKVKRLLRRDGV